MAFSLLTCSGGGLSLNDFISYECTVGGFPRRCNHRCVYSIILTRSVWYFLKARSHGACVLLNNIDYVCYVISIVRELSLCATEAITHLPVGTITRAIISLSSSHVCMWIDIGYRTVNSSNWFTWITCDACWKMTNRNSGVYFSSVYDFSKHFVAYLSVPSHVICGVLYIKVLPRLFFASILPASILV
jgi:hypothetical protein